MKHLQHGVDYAGQDITGWGLSEKLNGCRAYWNGLALYSKSGRVINAPGITAKLPRGLTLDGEIHAGRGNFEAARLFTQYGKPSDSVEFVVFDVPAIHDEWPARLLAAQRLGLQTVAPITCASHEQIAALLQEIVQSNGEGLMARKPGTFYTPGRGPNLLKLKQASLSLLALYGKQIKPVPSTEVVFMAGSSLGKTQSLFGVNWASAGPTRVPA